MIRSEFGPSEITILHPLIRESIGEKRLSDFLSKDLSSLEQVISEGFGAEYLPSIKDELTQAQPDDQLWHRLLFTLYKTPRWQNDSLFTESEITLEKVRGPFSEITCSIAEEFFEKPLPFSKLCQPCNHLF